MSFGGIERDVPGRVAPTLTLVVLGAQAVSAGESHWAILRSLLRATGTAGNLTSDAHLAALAVEKGAAVYSTDNDFKRFPGLEHVNPLL